MIAILRRLCANLIRLMLLPGLLLASDLASAADVQSMAGYWLGQVEGNTRERILILEAGKRVRYGYADGKLRVMDDAILSEPADGKWTLRFTSNAGSLIELRASEEDSSRLAGTLINKGGDNKQIIFTRLPPPAPLQAAELAGNWLLHVEGQDRDRILQLGTTPPGSETTGIPARYGYADSKLAAIPDVSLNDDGDLPRLHLTTPAAGTVDARYIHAGEGFFVGSIRPAASGRERPVRLTRIDLDAYREAAVGNLISRFRFSANTAIDVIYISGADCPFCREWAIANLHQGYHGFRDSPEWSAVTLTQAGKSSYMSSLIPASSFPERLKEVYAELNSDRKYRIVSTVTPAWVVAIDRKIARWGVGKQWQTDIYPFIQQAVAARNRAGATGN